LGTVPRERFEFTVGQCQGMATRLHCPSMGS